jgi:hypothetical protein
LYVVNRPIPTRDMGGPLLKYAGEGALGAKIGGGF